MNHRYAAVLIAIVALVTLTWGSAFARAILHLNDVPDWQDIPPNGSVWHEIAPVYCVDHTQTGYNDNGDGIVSVCDMIVLEKSGIQYSYDIEDVAVTYKVQYSEGCNPIAYMESYIPPDQNPVGQCWHIVYPPESFCEMKEILSWSDGNQNGIVDVCDNLAFGDCGYADKEEPLCHWHVEEVSLDITVGEGTAAESGAWGKIKALFNQLF